MAIRSCPRFLHPLYSFRTAGFPQYGWKPALSSCALPKPFRASFDAGAAVHPFLAFPIQASGTAAVPTGPWLSTVYHVRACNRYYGLIRQSDELRPAWLSQLTLAGLCPGRAVRLTFPSLPVVYGRACPSQGLPRPESAITTRPNHPLPRQDLHLQACQRLKAAHRNLLFARPARTQRCAVKTIRPRSSTPRKQFANHARVYGFKVAKVALPFVRTAISNHRALPLNTPGPKSKVTRTR